MDKYIGFILGEGRWEDRKDGTYREKRKGRKLAVKNEGFSIFLFITAALMKIHVFWEVQDIKATSHIRIFVFD